MFMLKKKRNEVLRAQQTVSAVIVALFIVGVFQTVYMIWAIGVFNEGGPWYSWYGAMQFTPLVVFAVLWLAVRGSLWERAYQALVLSAAATFSGAAFYTFFLFVMSFLYEYFNEAVMLQIYVIDFVVIILSQLIFAAIIMVVLKRQKSVSKLLNFSYSALVVSVVAYFVVMIIDTVAQAAMQYPTNQNLSAYVASFIGLGGIVIVGAVLYYLERKRKAKEPWKSAVFMTTMITMALYITVYLVGLIPNAFSVQSIAAVIIALGCVGGLFAFRWLYRTLRVLQ